MSENMSLKIRPLQVTRAAGLLWLSLLIGLFRSVIDWHHLRLLTASLSGLLVGVAFNLGMLALLTWKVSRGRNWARITFLVLTLLGLVPYVPILLSTFHRSPMMAAVSLVQTATQLFALVLLFTSPGREWFAVDQR